MDRIKEGFTKIKLAHDWAARNSENRQADYQTLLERLEVVFKELEKEGVNREYSAALFVFGNCPIDNY